MVRIVRSDTGLKRHLRIAPHREIEPHRVAGRVAADLDATLIHIRKIPRVGHSRILPVVLACRLVETVVTHHEFEIILLR